MRHNNIARQRQSGSVLAELAATMVVVIPLLFFFIFVAIEAAQAYGTWQSLQQGARESARRLAKLYAVHPGIVRNTADQKKYGFDPVRIAGVINDSSQLVASFGPTEQPNSVTVTATFKSGQFGLPPFPAIDPLSLGKDFDLKASATYTLE